MSSTLKSGLVSRRFSTPDRRVGEAIDRFLSIAVENATSGQVEPWVFRDLLTHCHRASLAWPVRLTTMTSDECRRNAVLAGPLFTSERFPWPAGQEQWLEPLLQIDLAVLSRLRRADLGSGWLQVWMSASGGTTRIVPAEEVELRPLAPLPSEQAADYHEVLTGRNDDAPGWLPGCAITGFEAPVVDYGHNELLAYADCMIEEASALPVAVLEAIIALRAAVDDDRNWIACSHRAFGMVNDSEVDASRIPPVLFVIEPDPPIIADSSVGNDALYVCYDNDLSHGSLVFSVHGRVS